MLIVMIPGNQTCRNAREQDIGLEIIFQIPESS